MAASGKVQVISTKYFMCINWGHYVIYLQNKKYVQLILWPGGAYTHNAYATKPESWTHIRIHFMNHDCIGSLWQSQMSQKLQKKWTNSHFFEDPQIYYIKVNFSVYFKVHVQCFTRVTLKTKQFLEKTPCASLSGIPLIMLIKPENRAKVKGI